MDIYKTGKVEVFLVRISSSSIGTATLMGYGELN